MEVTSIQNGIIIDHVPAGTALKVLEYLKIDPAKTKLALIMNTDSHMFGTKDIIKIESEEEAETIDLDVLGLVARTATVGIVRGGKIVEKKQPTLPEHVVNIIKCVNPRCVTTTEPAVQMFHLVHSDRQEYRCDYCDEEAKFCPMTLTLHDIKVWNTGEVIDLIVPSDADETVDASAMTIAPGFEDPHVHFRDPGQTYKESMVSGCAAAASGGYTNVLIMPNTVPAMDGVKVTAGEPGASEVLDAGFDTVIDYLQHYEQAHDVTLPVRYDLCVCASKGRAGKEATDVADWIGYLPEHDDDNKDAYQLCHPVTAISDDGSAVTPEILDQVFDNVKKSGLYLIEHCEHHDTGAVNEGPVSRELGVPGIPEDTELKIVERDIEMARKTGVHVHFQHVSTAISFDAIRKAKAEGLPITCETAPHYVALCDEALLKYGTLAKMNPPLRSEEDRKATIAAVADGTVDLLATDHAPHTMEEKDLGFLDAPNGIIGLECAYGVCHKILVDGGFISDERLIELMSTAPAELMGHSKADVTALLDEYADAVPGDDDTKRVLDLVKVPAEDRADLVVLNTDEAWTVNPERFHSSARNTPFGGWQVTGRPLATIIGSKLVFSRINKED